MSWSCQRSILQTSMANESSVCFLYCLWLLEYSISLERMEMVESSAKGPSKNSAMNLEKLNARFIIMSQTWLCSQLEANKILCSTIEFYIYYANLVT